MKRSLLIPSLFAFSLAGPLPARAADAQALEPLRLLAIQDGGRVKPLDTFARELAKSVQGAKPFGFERVGFKTAKSSQNLPEHPPGTHRFGFGAGGQPAITRCVWLI